MGKVITELPEFPELTFDENGHIYRLNGIPIPSVTTLMKPLSEDFYSGVDPDTLNRAAERGTAIHNAVENFLEFGIRDVEPQYSGYFAAFLKWWEDSRPETLAAEKRVYHKQLRYAGTADLICRVNGILTLVDYKTSYQVNDRLCAVQLEGYDRAFESHGVEVDDRLILHLSKNGVYQVQRFSRSTRCWSVLSALMTIKNYMNA